VILEPEENEAHCTPPTEGNYTIPEEARELVERTRRYLETIGATPEQIHTILAPTDPLYVSPCCGLRECAVNMGMTVSAILFVRLIIMMDEMDEGRTDEIESAT
jgi:hypothetical protein